MRLFRIPERNPEHLQGEKPRQRAFRYAAIGILFCGVIWGFWTNHERYTARMQGGAVSRMDATGTLSEEQEEALHIYTRRFVETYGIAIVIRARGSAFPQGEGQGEPLPAEKAGTLFLGISPANRQVVLQVPPLAAAALGDPLILYLRHLHFIPYFVNGTWPEGMAAALSMLSRRLDAALGPVYK